MSIQQISGTELFLSETLYIDKYFEGRYKIMKDEIMNLTLPMILANGENETIDFYVDKYAIAIPCLGNLYRDSEVKDSVISEPNPFRKQIRGEEVAYAADFTGNPDFLYMNLGQWSSWMPSATVIERQGGGTLTFKYASIQIDEKVEQVAIKNYNSIKEYFEILVRKVESYNASLKEKSAEFVKFRLRKLEERDKNAASLTIPLKKASEAKTVYMPPKAKRSLKGAETHIANMGLPSRFLLDESDFEYILKVISSFSLALQRTPRVFESLDEDTLRDFLLVVLNSHFEGLATGETFNSEGKSDILIRYKDANVFICECKIWKGKAKIESALVQLFKYLTSSDTKCSLIIFSRNKNFNDVLSSLREQVGSHKLYTKLIAEHEEYSRYVFKHPKDENKSLDLVILPFHIPI